MISDYQSIDIYNLLFLFCFSINQEASTSQMDVDPQLPFSIEAIDELYKRKIQEAKREYEQIHNLTGEISRLQSDLKKKIKERNIKIKRLKF